MIDDDATTPGIYNNVRHTTSLLSNSTGTCVYPNLDLPGVPTWRINDPTASNTCLHPHSCFRSPESFSEVFADIRLSFGRFHPLNARELSTTLRLENAIAAPAIIGCMCSPSGKNRPIASGMQNKLYRHAHTRFLLIVPSVFRERSSAATMSSRSGRMRTMSAASTAMDVPDESAIPTVAAASAGESLIPSPTYRGS